jgi:hypothetical protein
MKLTKIDLSQIVAVGHNNGQLGLLIDRGEEIDYIEIPAPEVAYDGLQSVSNLANNRVFLGGDQDPNPLRGSLPLDRCGEGVFLDEQDQDEEEEPLIELECCDPNDDEYYPVEIVDQELSPETPNSNQLLNIQVPGYC